MGDINAKVLLMKLQFVEIGNSLRRCGGQVLAFIDVVAKVVEAINYQR